MGHGLFTDKWWEDVIEPTLAEAGAGPAFRRMGWLITAIDDDDPERARADARRMVGFYLTVRTYDPLIERHGWEAAVTDLRASFASGDMKSMTAAVSDDMLDAITLCGTTAEAAERLRSRRVVPTEALLSPPSFLVSGRRQDAYALAAARFAADHTSTV